MKSNLQKRSGRKILNVFIYITAIVYINFLSCTSLDVFRKDDENSIYHPQPGDSVLIETKSGKFYTSVIVDTSGEYITTENHKISKKLIVDIAPRKSGIKWAIIAITGAIAFLFVYALVTFFGSLRE